MTSLQLVYRYWQAYAEFLTPYVYICLEMAYWCLKDTVNGRGMIASIVFARTHTHTQAN